MVKKTAFADNVNYIHSDEVGRIVCICSLPKIVYDAALSNLPAGHKLTKGKGNPAEHWVNENGTKVYRKPLSITVSGTSIKNIPIPSQLYIDGKKYECNEDHVDLEFNAPGVYRVVIQSWPFKDKEVQIEVKT